MPELKIAWGCEAPTTPPNGFLYDLGGVVINRCPLSLLKATWVQRVYELYAFYKRGITPNGAGLRGETAFYRECMMTMESLSAEAESWYSKQLEKRRKK